MEIPENMALKRPEEAAFYQMLRGNIGGAGNHGRFPKAADLDSIRPSIPRRGPAVTIFPITRQDPI